MIRVRSTVCCELPVVLEQLAVGPPVIHELDVPVVSKELDLLPDLRLDVDVGWELLFQLGIVFIDIDYLHSVTPLE